MRLSGDEDIYLRLRNNHALRGKLWTGGSLAESIPQLFTFLTMRTLRHAAILLGFSATAGTVFTLPSHAADMDSFNNSPSGANPLGGLAIPGVDLNPAVIPLGPSSGPSIGSGIVTLENPAPNTYSVKTGFAPTVNTALATGEFKYELTLTGGETWAKAQLTSNVLAGFPGANFVKQVCKTNFGVDCINISISNTSASPVEMLMGFGNTIYVTDTYTGTIPSAQISDMTNTFTTVPGPLPVLGAGAAFGFSRKLRKRIKASA